jgi:Mrp family chromosome partitioning ATPase/capsular polysaccharide biosynthesis protein
VEHTPSSEPADLREYLRPLLTRWWLILAVVAVATGGTYAYYAAKPKEYTATTQVFLEASQVDQALFGATPASDDRNTQNQVVLLTSRSVAKAVARRIDYEGDPGELLSSIRATPESGSDFVRVEATSDAPRRAARLANAFAQAFIRVRSAAARSQIRAARENAERERARLADVPANAAARGALESRIRRLRAIGSLPVSGAKQVDPALPPSRSSAPKPRRNALFAFAVSLMLAAGLAYALERLDRRIKRIDDLEALYGLPLLSAVPHSAGLVNPATTATATTPHREPFRTLRTNLQLAALDRRLRTVVVTSAVPGEGKSMVVRNLALACREAGLRVAVVDSDLRVPSLASLFNVRRRPGLTDVLTGSGNLDDALQPVAAEGDRPRVSVRVRALARTSGNGAEGEANLGSLAVLTSGPPPPNPPAVLATERLQAVLDEIAATHDIVLIDSSPLLAVSDALPLISKADGTIVVGRLGLVTRDAVAAVTDLLGRVPGVDVLGIVANDVSERRLGAVGSGYFAHYHEAPLSKG